MISYLVLASSIVLHPCSPYIEVCAKTVNLATNRKDKSARNPPLADSNHLYHISSCPHSNKHAYCPPKNLWNSRSTHHSLQWHTFFFLFSFLSCTIFRLHVTTHNGLVPYNTCTISPPTCIHFTRFTPLPGKTLLTS